jgi:hypothetical protein
MLPVNLDSTMPRRAHRPVIATKIRAQTNARERLPANEYAAAAKAKNIVKIASPDGLVGLVVVRPSEAGPANTNKVPAAAPDMGASLGLLWSVVTGFCVFSELLSEAFMSVMPSKA